MPHHHDHPDHNLDQSELGAEVSDEATPPRSHPEAPDADAAEQSRPLRPEHDVAPSASPEVDEYDAIEQSRVVADDEERREP